MQFGFQVLYGIGGGILFPGRLCAMQASQLDTDAPMATVLNSLATSLGQAFGVGIGATILQNVWGTKVAQSSAAGLIPAQYILSKFQAEQAGSLISMFPDAVQDVYRLIMADVIDALFIALAGFSGLALVGSLFSRNLSLDRESHSKHEFIEGADVREKVDEESSYS